jgi:hypothetical protein
LLSEDQYLVVAHSKGENLAGTENIFVLKKSDSADPMPTEIIPIQQKFKTAYKKIEDISNLVTVL